MSDFEGKVAVVTGGAHGIGLAVATDLASRGASVVVTDIDEKALLDVSSQLSADGRNVLGVRADVSSEQDAIRVADATASKFGAIDILFANAGIGGFGDVLSTTPDAWDRMLAVNLRGAFLSARAVLPHMIERGGGAICVTSSDCAIRTCNESVAYVVSKHGLIGLARSIAVDFGKFGIRANVVVPGVTDTHGLRSWYSTPGHNVDAGIGKAAALSPLGRVGQPQDIAEVVAFLCSDRASFMTGALVVVDGGMTVTYGAD